MAVFYERNRFTLIDWEQRLNLRGKDLARWLHLYFAGNAAQYPVSVEFLREKSGSRAKSLRHYREKLRLALEQLKAIGFLISWNIDPISDLVTVERVPSPAQQRHIAKKAAKRWQSTGIDRHLFPKKCHFPFQIQKLIRSPNFA